MSGVEAVAWIRFCSDGLYEGPIHDCQIDDVRRRSGVWTPLVPKPDYDTLRAQLEAAEAEVARLPDGWREFIADLERSRGKYPNNAYMFDGLIGEVEELSRAYDGDGDIPAEAFDVAVCAFRIATEGDAGGNMFLGLVKDANRYMALRCAAVNYGVSIDPESLAKGDYVAFDAHTDKIAAGHAARTKEETK